MSSEMARKTAAKYRGRIAETYDSQRSGQEKWKAEDRVVRGLLADLPAGTRILDVPVGTGRFLPLYAERGFEAIGIDVSRDMLDKARAKAPTADLRQGDIFALDLPDKSVDVALAVRIMNLIDADDMVKALGELQRVARSRVIFNLRVWHPATTYRRPQREETVHRALASGWSIMDSVRVHHDDFRMFVLCAG